ncbi:MAG: hypothetical protein SPI59_00725 [Finegoldia sp.]|nr:hypothetical protein [Finegoldia sp.]
MSEDFNRNQENLNNRQNLIMEENNQIPGYRNRHSEGYAGIIGSIHKGLRSLIDKAEAMSGAAVIIYLIGGLFNYLAYRVSLFFNRAAFKQVEDVYGNVSGGNIIIEAIFTILFSALLMYALYNFIFLFTKKNMAPIDKHKKNIRNAIIAAITSLLGILIMIIPFQTISFILEILITAIVYAGVFYDYVEDDQMATVSVKPILVELLAGFLFGIIIAAVVFAILFNAGI